MKDARIASCIATLLAIGMMAGCAKQEAASTSTDQTPAGEAAYAPENDESATAIPADESAVTSSEDGEAAPAN